MASERGWWAVRLRTGALHNGRVYLSRERADEVRAGIVWHSREGAEVIQLAPAPRFTAEDVRALRAYSVGGYVRDDLNGIADRIEATLQGAHAASAGALADGEWYRIGGDSHLLTLTQSAAVAWGAQSRGATIAKLRLVPLGLVRELPYVPEACDA